MMFVDEFSKIKSSKKDLRDFGFVVGGAILLIGGYLIWKNESYSIALLGVAIVVVGVVTPIILLPAQKIWMAFSIIVGFFMTKIILIAVYYLVVSPIAILARLFGKEFITITLDDSADSYWNLISDQKFQKSQYKKMF
jgi:hypothetical protein